MGKAEGIRTYGVWLGDEPVPGGAFDEVVTEVPSAIQPAMAGAELPEGEKGLRVLSDIVRIYEGMRRPGWLYRDFDCAVRSLPPLNGKAHFARYGKHQIDHFLFYTGDCKALKDLFATLMLRCLRAGRMIMAYADAHQVLNQRLLGKVGVIESEHFAHGDVLHRL